MPSPEETLAVGRGVIEAVLAPYGFVWVPGSTGHGSGGDFASGEFVRDRRRLQLHFRHSLGMVTYHLGERSLDHAAYMRAVLGADGGSQYPGFSDDPIDAFRHLAHDLAQFCGSFLGESDAPFEAVLLHAKQERARKLP